MSRSLVLWPVASYCVKRGVVTRGLQDFDTVICISIQHVADASIPA